MKSHSKSKNLAFHFSKYFGTGVRKEVAGSNAGQACLIGRKSFTPGATFRPDPCTDCTCQPDATTVCFRDIRRGTPTTCPNLYPASRASPATASATTVRAEQETGVSLPSTGVNGVGGGGMFQHQPQQPPTALPASRPLTCAYRGVTYQVSFFLSSFFYFFKSGE